MKQRIIDDWKRFEDPTLDKNGHLINTRE